MDISAFEGLQWIIRWEWSVDYLSDVSDIYDVSYLPGMCCLSDISDLPDLSDLSGLCYIYIYLI